MPATSGGSTSAPFALNSGWCSSCGPWTGKHNAGCLYTQKPGTLTPSFVTGTITTQAPLCPDLLRLSDIGEADSWRGHVVRGFFWLLRKVTGV